MTLAIASTSSEVVNALGPGHFWFFDRDRYLCQTFVAVLVLDDLMHTGQSEHAWFVKGLIGHANWNPIARGPQSRRPGRVQARPKRTDRFRAKVQTPSPETSPVVLELPREMTDGARASSARGCGKGAEGTKT